MARQWNDLLTRLSKASGSDLKLCFSTMNDEIKSSLQIKGSADGVTAAPMARLLLLITLGISDDERIASAGTIKLNTVKWTSLAKDISNFVETLPTEVRTTCCHQAKYTDDTIAAFATLSSRVQGSGAPFFYSTILLYLISYASSGGLNSNYLNTLVSREDRIFIANAAFAIQDRLNFSYRTGNNIDVVSISQRFFVDRGLQTDLATFARNFTVPNAKRKITCGFQFAIYRPMKSNPDNLIKTFAALYDQADGFLDANGFTYSHFYQPPSADGQMRFSRGKAIPLNDAVYFIGGQRPLSDHRGPMPYNSLKVMAIRWSDIRKNHLIFPMLVMTTNYDGKIMVSRAAGRLTPIDHSDDARLSSMSVSKLASSLAEDASHEKGWIMNRDDIDDDVKKRLCQTFPLTKDRADIDRIAKLILYYSNNDPHKESGWCVPAGFKNKRSPLTTDSLRALVGQATGESDGNPFKNEAGDVFNLWDHSRFGPLRID